eukprot:COSAG04_NODE_5531_length_1581_cov_1.742915_1_plen_294_part_10
MSSKKAAKKGKKKKGQGGEKSGLSGAAVKRAARFLAAARVGDCGAMERLIEGGLDIDAMSETTSKDGKKMQATALLQAVGFNHQAAMQLLLDRGADPNLANSLGATPLMHAAVDGSAKLVHLLMEANAEADTAIPGTGWTAFHFTCDNDQPDCAEALVRAGCDTSLRDKAGETGRDKAQRKGHAAVLERLDALEQGDAASKKTTDSNSEKAAGSSESLKLTAAAAAGECGAMERLIHGGLDVDTMADVQDEEGKLFQSTALCEAVKKQHAAAARLLLARGANPSLANSRGGTPL